MCFPGLDELPARGGNERNNAEEDHLPAISFGKEAGERKSANLVWRQAAKEREQAEDLFPFPLLFSVPTAGDNKHPGSRCAAHASGQATAPASGGGPCDAPLSQWTPFDARSSEVSAFDPCCLLLPCPARLLVDPCPFLPSRVVGAVAEGRGGQEEPGGLVDTRRAAVPEEPQRRQPTRDAVRVTTSCPPARLLAHPPVCLRGDGRCSMHDDPPDRTSSFVFFFCFLFFFFRGALLLLPGTMMMRGRCAMPWKTFCCMRPSHRSICSTS